MSFLLTLNIFYTCVSIVKFELVNAGWGTFLALFDYSSTKVQNITIGWFRYAYDGQKAGIYNFLFNIF